MAETYTLRSDLIVSRQGTGPQEVYIIKDPVTGRFFKLRGPEYFLVSQMDGHTTTAMAVEKFRQQFGLDLAPGAAEAFFHKMQRLCLFAGTYAEAALTGEKRIASAQRSRWSKYLLWRIASFNPEHLVATVERYTRWLFTPEWLLVAITFIFGSLSLAVANHATFFIGLPQIFQVGSIVGILAAIFVIAVFHEFGHAVALRHHGGRVSEMGFLLLYFQPSVYCNLSDAYLLPRKRQKAQVLLAGLFAQLLVTALAVLLWRVTELGTVVNRFAFLISAVSLAIVLFNLNPLIKLDGYYLLADQLGMPNLRRRAFGYLGRQFRRWVVGTDMTDPDDRHGQLFWIYGLVALSYSVALLGFVGYHLTRFLATELGLAGPLVLWGVVLVLTLRPLWRSSETQDKKPTEPPAPKPPPDAAGKTPSSPAEKEQPAKRQRSRRPLIFWGIVLVLLICSFVIPAELKVGATCHVEPAGIFRVYIVEAGIIDAEMRQFGEHDRHQRTSLQWSSADFAATEITPRYSVGDNVRQGDTVLVISSNRYYSQLASTQARLRQAEAQLDLLLSGPKEDEIRQLRAELTQIEAQLENEKTDFTRRGRMFEQHLISEEEYEMAKTRLAIIEAALNAKQSELSLLISDPKIEEIAVKEAEIAELEALVDYYQSQIDASVFMAPFAGRISRIRHEDTILELIRTDTMRIVIPTSEDDIGEVDIGALVKLKVRSYPGDVFSDLVAKLAIAPVSDNGDTRYNVITKIPNDKGRLLAGMTGHAKIYCGKRPLISLILRQIIYFFRVEFWSWW